MSIKVMLAVADGSEDIETVTVSDVLRRAGIEGGIGVGDAATADYLCPWHSVARLML